MKYLFIAIISVFVNPVFASENHKHNKEEKHRHDNIDEESRKSHKHTSHENEEKYGDHSEADGHGHEAKHGHGEHEEDAHGHGHGHGASEKTGVGKAIIEVDENKGFKLSPEAISAIKIELKPIERKEFDILKDVLVTTKNEKGIYVQRKGHFKFFHLSQITATRTGFLIHFEAFVPGDLLVVKGLGPLRVADIYSTDNSEYGHAH